MKNYIGITGITKSSEIYDTLSLIEELHSTQTYMFGFLVSKNTINGVFTQNKRYLNFNNIKELKSLMDISANRPNIINMIHYNTNTIDFAEEVCDMLEKLEDSVEAIQFNLNTINLSEYRKIKQKFPNIDLLLQLNQKNLNKNFEINEIIEEGLFTYLLMDLSGGSGKEFNLDSSMRYIKSLNKNISKGIAGGINHENVASIISRLNEYNINISIDSESGLRDKISNTYGDDVWNQKKVNEYIIKSMNLNKKQIIRMEFKILLLNNEDVLKLIDNKAIYVLDIIGIKTKENNVRIIKDRRDGLEKILSLENFMKLYNL